MAAAAAEAAEDELDEHSPSKRFYGIGNFAGVGFINALIDNVSRLERLDGKLPDLLSMD